MTGAVIMDVQPFSDMLQSHCAIAIHYYQLGSEFCREERLSAYYKTANY
jgi:hypothetical protein